MTDVSRSGLALYTRSVSIHVTLTTTSGANMPSQTSLPNRIAKGSAESTLPTVAHPILLNDLASLSLQTPFSPGRRTRQSDPAEDHPAGTRETCRAIHQLRTQC